MDRRRSHVRLSQRTKNGEGSADGWVGANHGRGWITRVGAKVDKGVQG